MLDSVLISQHFCSLSWQTRWELQIGSMQRLGVLGAVRGFGGLSSAAASPAPFSGTAWGLPAGEQILFQVT